MKKMKLLSTLAIAGLVLTACGNKPVANEAPSVSSTEIISENGTTVEPSSEPSEEPSKEATPETPPEPEEPAPQNDESEGDFHGEIQNCLAELEQLYQEEKSYDKTINIFEKDKEIIALNTYDFSDKKISFIGDSISYGQGGSVNEYGNKISYVDYIRDILGCDTYNISIAGSTIGTYGGDQCMFYKLNEVPEDSDIVFIYGGVNDYLSYGQYFGNADEKEDGTFCGDVYRLFSRIQDRCKDADIFVVTTFPSAIEHDSFYTTSYPLDTYLDVIRDTARDYDLNRIELYHIDYLDSNIERIRNEFFTDDIHPNDDGNRLLAKHFCAQLIAFYN